MAIKRQYIKIVMLISIVSLMVFSSSTFEQEAKSSRLKDVDWGWLPNLTGLPNADEVATIKEHIAEVLKEDDDEGCKAVDDNLKMMVLTHFAIKQKMANAQGHYFNDTSAHKWAHMLGMTLKESSGDSTNVTGMTGRSVTTHKPRTDLKNWRKMLTNAQRKHIKLDYQTNYGLTQTSTDRLFVAFNLAKNKGYYTEYLEGKEGPATYKKVRLDTAIAIRRLVWFYQDFAQGRISQSESRIYKEDIKKPEYSDRYHEGLRLALLYCGTNYMFKKESDNDWKDEPNKFEDAIASIAYCRLGNSKSGYGRNQFDGKCFAQWVTLCPSLNMDIAILTPLSYFATRDEKPVCEKTFKRLIIKNPADDK